MNDLQKLWDEYPTGRAPIADILAGSRSRQRRTRRPVLAATALAVAGAAVVVASMVGGTGPDGSTPSVTDARPVAFQAGLDPVTGCDELLRTHHERALEQLTPWGWRWSSWPGEDGAMLESARTADLGALTPLGSSATGTNVQEPGIDEPDTAKTDGRVVVTLRGDRLIVHDVTGTVPARTGSVRLPRFREGELLLIGSTVVAIGADAASGRDALTGQRRGTRVITVSLDTDEPRIDTTTTYSSRVVAARQTGSTVRLVLAESPPDLDFVQPGPTLTPREARALNRRAVEESTLEDWMPTRDDGGGREPLLDCTDVAAPAGSTGIGTVSVVGFSVDARAQESAVALVGSASIAYASAGHVYLAENGDWSNPVARIHDFELDGIHAVHVASGRVRGTIADRWSMDEHGDVLRIALGRTGRERDANAVATVLRRGQDLVEVGRVGGLGPDEEIKAVRWLDDLAVVVTFREVDPLYSIDLSDPARPRSLGVLKVPGFSGYLHPVGDDQLMGVGYADANESAAQVSLFDVSDLSSVRQTDVTTYRATRVLAPDDPRAFTWLPDRNVALTVVESGRRVSIATLAVEGDRVTERLTPVAAGDGRVRTLGLPDGRVALVVGDEVSFFDLP